MKIATKAVMVAARQARRRGLDAHRIAGTDNVLSILGRRCEVLPGRVVTEEPGKPIRPHPSWGEPADFLVFVVAEGKARQCFIMPATASARAGAWAIPAREIECYRDAWNVLERVKGLPASPRRAPGNRVRPRAGPAP